MEEESDEGWTLVSPTDFLRRNDPDTSEFGIALSLFSTDPEVKAFAEALEQNEYINDILFDMGGTAIGTNWDPLLRVLSKHGNLRMVQFEGKDREPRPSTTLITMFLRALQQNAKISSAVFIGIFFSDEDIGFFVDTASSVEILCFVECDFLDANQQQDASNLASAIQRKTNLDTLVLDSMRDIYLQQIVQCLGSIVCLKKLVFAGSLSMNETSSLAIQHLLVSTKTITGLDLISWDTNAVENMVAFRNIVQGLINSTTVQNVVFSTCTFGTNESIGLLKSIIQRKQNLHSLEILDCGPISDFNLLMKALSGCLVRADSPMRNLSFHGSLPDSAFSAFLNAVEKSKLEQLSFSKISSLRQLQMMAKSIPTMKVKDLVLYVEYSGPGLDKALLEAVKKNSSLQSYKLVLLDHLDRFHGAAEAEAKWNQCLVRNAKMAGWIEKPSTITKCVWPDALASAAEVADPSVLFQALRTVGSEFGPSVGKRKRKRTSFYIPSS